MTHRAGTLRVPMTEARARILALWIIRQVHLTARLCRRRGVAWNRLLLQRFGEQAQLVDLASLHALARTLWQFAHPRVVRHRKVIELPLQLVEIGQEAYGFVALREALFGMKVPRAPREVLEFIRACVGALPSRGRPRQSSSARRHRIELAQAGKIKINSRKVRRMKAREHHEADLMAGFDDVDAS